MVPQVSRKTVADVNEALQPAAPPVPPLADPGPLGLAAFAMTTFVLSFFNVGLFDKALEPVVLPLALFYGGLGQVLAGMWEVKKNNTFGALAFTSYGAFWLAFAAFVQFVVPNLPADSAHLATGLFLAGWAIFTGYMMIASLRTSVGLIVVFVALFLTFVFLCIGAFSGVQVITAIGGGIGLFTALAAWYCSFAGVLNATWGRIALPMGPRSS